MRNKTLQKCHLFIIYKFTNPFLTTLQLGRRGSRVARLWIYKFVNNKQMAFLQSFVSQQLLFLFSKHLNTMSNATDCVSGRIDLCITNLNMVSLWPAPRTLSVISNAWIFMALGSPCKSSSSSLESNSRTPSTSWTLSLE